MSGNIKCITYILSNATYESILYVKLIISLCDIVECTILTSEKHYELFKLVADSKYIFGIH